MEWSHTWDELTEPPQYNPRGLYLPLRNPKKVLGLFTSTQSGKLVIIDSQEKCEVKTTNELLDCALELSDVNVYFHLVNHNSYSTGDQKESGENDEFVATDGNV